MALTNEGSHLELVVGKPIHPLCLKGGEIHVNKITTGLLQQVPNNILIVLNDSDIPHSGDYVSLGLILSSSSL